MFLYVNKYINIKKYNIVLVAWSQGAGCEPGWCRCSPWACCPNCSTLPPRVQCGFL